MKHVEIRRRRMRNSRLTGKPFTRGEEVVRWHGAMQAQDFGPAKWSIAQRAKNVSNEDIDRALTVGSIVRTHVLRPTWHFVARDHVRWLLALTGPRVHQTMRSRRRELELDEKTLTRCEALIASALEGGNQLSRNAIGRVLEGAGIDTSGQRLAHILMHCELQSVICSGAPAGKQQTYALLDERVPSDGRCDRDEALAELARRYLNSHGPATVQDLRWWSSMTVADIRNALHMLASEVKSETVDGVTLWSIGSEETSMRSGRKLHLLQPYDELVVGYSESRYFGDPRAAAARAAARDRRLPTGVVLLDAGLAGHWKRTIEKDRIRIEVLVYDELKQEDAAGLEAAAAQLGRFLRSDVTLETTPLSSS